MASQEETKLSDEEKYKLIEFYKKNPELWVVNQGISRGQKSLKKDELLNEFEGKFQIESLEKAFHGLPTSFLREFKKYKERNLPKKPWKFYKSMLFLKEEQVVRRAVFSVEEREILITFYQNNPVLWNHGMVEYRDRNIRCSLIQKLVEQFDEKFTEEDIKKEWNSLLTHYKREKQSEVTSRPSGAGTDDIFNSNWEHFDQMEFLEATPQTDSSINTLEQEILTPPVAKRSRLSKKSDATDPKAVLFTALANSLNTQTTHNCKPQDPLVERANLFGKTVADNLLQCDLKDWTFLKKKIFDLFYEYEQGNLLTRSISTASFSSTGFPSGTGFQTFGYNTNQTQQHFQPIQPLQAQSPLHPSLFPC